MMILVYSYKGALVVLPSLTESSLGSLVGEVWWAQFSSVGWFWGCCSRPVWKTAGSYSVLSIQVPRLEVGLFG